MTCSPEQLAANRRNSTHSTGPITAEGKAISRRNGLKHGLAGEGVALPDEDEQEVEIMAAGFRRSFRPADPEAEVMVRRLAVMAVRMDRCVEYETATLSAKVRDAMNDPAHETEAQLREAVALAKFDHSPESASVRRYEAAASREFFKTLKALKSREPSDQPMIHSIPGALIKTTSSELASSRPSTPTPPAPMLATPFDRPTSSLKPVSASDPMNFSIGKPPGSRS